MKVESNIPMPSKFPFAGMEVGDSFLVPEGVLRATVTVAALRYGRKNGMKFTVRKVPEGFRCWRVQ